MDENSYVEPENSLEEEHGYSVPDVDRESFSSTENEGPNLEQNIYEEPEEPKILKQEDGYLLPLPLYDDPL